MLALKLIVIDLGLTLALGIAGATGAWWMRRRTTLSPRSA